MTKWWALALLIGCGGDEPSVQPDAGDVDAPAGARIRIGGTVYSFDPAKPLDDTQTPLPGAEMCLEESGQPRCATTDASGRWELDAPANAGRLEFTTTAPGHLSVYEVYFTSAADELAWTLYMAPDALARDFLQSCGVGFDANKTGVLLKGFKYTPPDDYVFLDGAIASTDVGGGPCYMAMPYMHDPEVQTSKAAGLGITVFGDLPATSGKVDVTVSLAGTTCGPYLDLVDDLGNGKISIPVRAGFQTLVNVVCE